MSRPLLLLITGSMALGTGFAAARVQCANFDLAGQLDEISRECAWLERCALEHRQRIATAAFETELFLKGREVDAQGTEEVDGAADA